MTNTLENIRTFIEREFLPEEGDGLGPTDNLLEKGILDSIAVLQVVHFLEDTYGIKVEDGEISLENFQDLASIDRLVTRKRNPEPES